MRRHLTRLDAGSVAAILLLFVPLFAVFRQQLADPDLWWHLAAGRWIVEHGAVPWTDPFSSTANGRLWIAYSWLVELAFHALVEGAGFHALIVATAVTAAVLVGIVYAACRRAGAGANAALLSTILFAGATAGGWAERPQLVSLVLLAALVCLLRSPFTRARLVWFAPPLFAIWANVHILFFVGIGILALHAICETLDGDRRPGPWIAVAAAAAATLVNPYGWHLIAHLPTMIRQPSIIRVVAEFQSPDFSGPLGALLGASILGTTAVLAASRLRPTLWEITSVLGTLGAGLYMARNMAIFAIVAAPTVARHLDSLLPQRPAQPGREIAWPLLALHYLLVAAALVLATAHAPRSADWRDNLAPGVFPVAAADFVAEHHAGARLFNDFDSGGFLIHRLWPATMVSMDGRTQVFGERILRRYLRTHFVAADWERFLDECDPEVVLWPAATPLAAVLERSPGWRREFSDAVAVVFVRTEPRS